MNGTDTNTAIVKCKIADRCKTCGLEMLGTQIAYCLDAEAWVHMPCAWSPRPSSPIAVLETYEPPARPMLQSGTESRRLADTDIHKRISAALNKPQDYL